ncbi:MAG: anaerobic nitric oxide reductase transcription regulator [Planctomycetota bacterium]|jgi:anaerobic nitric oxide reductase transcription regulator
MNELHSLHAIALDLNQSLLANDRYERLLSAIERVAPSDASCLMIMDNDELVPLAARGLVPEALGIRFRQEDHPRLAIIAAASEPIRFPEDSPLADPFDGLVASDTFHVGHIHACLGCPLIVDGTLVGILTLDALDPQAFEQLSDVFLSTLGALAGAVMRTASLIDSLAEKARRENMVAHELMSSTFRSGRKEMLGTSAAMDRLRSEIDLVALTNYPVLISGETGVGKEMVAQAIHNASSRARAPLIRVNCAALPETLAESELFGHKRGSFSGADRDRAGKFVVADTGTLFLDEIGELPLQLQAKLLRVVQDGEVQRVGDDQPIKVDVRLITATNRDLEEEVRLGRFRADLYHRLAVYPLLVPPLRSRRTDIPLLIGHFCEQIRRRHGLAEIRIDSELRDRMQQADWPGNVRELENTVSRLVLRSATSLNPGSAVRITDSLSFNLGESDIQTSPNENHNIPKAGLRESVRQYQRQMILTAVNQNEGNWAAAARALQLDRSNLYNLAKRLGIREE